METKTCTTCNRTLPLDDFYSGKAACKACHRQRVDSRRAVLRSAGCCIECRAPVSGAPLCDACKKVHRDRYYDNRARYGEKSKERRQRLKLAALNAYGGPRCACCGELHLEFLTIDHIEKNGAEHRREMLEERGWNADSRSMSGSHMYLWLRQKGYPPGFRVLCFNCNFALGHFGYCPHQKSE